MISIQGSKISSIQGNNIQGTNIQDGYFNGQFVTKKAIMIIQLFLIIKSS